MLGLNTKIIEILVFTLVLAIVFSFAYKVTFDVPYTKCLYQAGMIQMMGGSTLVPQNDRQRIVIVAQTMIAFLISTGAIAYTLMFTSSAKTEIIDS